MSVRATTMVAVLAAGLASPIASTAASTLDGRVLEAETDAPLAGFTIRLFSLDALSDAVEGESRGELEAVLAQGPQVVALAVTDAEGRFRLEHEIRKTARITAQDKQGWKIVGRPTVIREIEGAPDSEIVFRFRRARYAQARLRIVDDKGRPLPDLRFELRPAERDEAPETLRSDAEGRVVTRRTYADGRLKITVVDHPEMSQESTRWVTHRHLAEGDREYDVRVDVGPSYRLGLELPPHLAPQDLVAELFNPARETPEDERKFVTAPVRPGDPPWVRFHVRAAQSMRGPDHPWRLRVSSRDGRYSGSEQVDWLWGPYPSIVRIAIVEGGTVPEPIAAAVAPVFDGPPASFGFRVFDGETGREIRQPHIVYRDADGLRRGLAIDVEQAVIREHPLDAPLEWRVGSPGYAPVFGDIDNHTQIVETEEGPLRIARITLYRGWGTRVRVASIAGKPVEGVELKLDGVPFGLTDAEGELVISLPKRPMAGALSKPGLRELSIDRKLRESEIEVVMFPDS